MRVAIWIIMGIILVGCITKHSGIDSNTAQWKVGKTTRRDVVARWGNPDKMEENIWIWKDWNLNGGRLKAAYMMVGLTIANTQAATTEFRLTFNEQGVLTKIEALDSIPSGAEWSINPWN